MCGMADREKYITSPSFLIRVLTTFGLCIFEAGSLYIGVTTFNEYFLFFNCLKVSSIKTGFIKG